jgi:hypothetical protein
MVVAIFPVDGSIIPLQLLPLEWEPPTVGGTPLGYDVRISANTVPIETDAWTRVTGVTEWTPNITLTHNTTYFWQVRPFNSGGEGEISTFQFSTVNMKATAVYPDNGHPNIPIRSTFSWIPTSDSGVPDGYKVRISTTNPPTGDFTDVGANTEWEPSLQVDTEYFWEVVPYYSAGDGESSIFSFKTVIVDLPAPSNVRAFLQSGDTFGTHRVVIEWEKPLNGWPDGYFIYRDGRVQNTMSQLSTERSFPDNNVVSGHTYKYEVVAFYDYRFETHSTIVNSQSQTSGEENTSSHSRTTWAEFNPTISLGPVKFSPGSAGVRHEYRNSTTQHFSETYLTGTGTGITYTHGPFYIPSRFVTISVPHDPPNPPQNL